MRLIEASNQRTRAGSRALERRLNTGARETAIRNPQFAVPLIACVLLAGITGCPPVGPISEGAGPVEQQVPLDRVVARINENAARMDFVLEAQGNVEARHVRSDGKPESLHDGRVKLLFRKPRDLYMKLEHTFDEVMQLGSNRTEFWVWKKINEDRYWWGRHELMTLQAEADLPIRPVDVVEVLGMGELPTQQDPRTGPLFEVLPGRYLLTFLSARGDGTMYPARRLWIDRRAPYLLREVEYLSPAGRVLTKAFVGDYRWVKGTSVMIPRRVRIEWPTRGEFLDMSFTDLERYDRDPARAFTSPLQQGRDVGEQIRVDRRPVTAAGAVRGPAQRSTAAGGR